MFLAPDPGGPRYRLSLDTPLGWLTLVADRNAITALDWGRAAEAPSPVVKDGGAQLREYFAGTRRAFDLPLAPSGSAHELRLWAELCRIPYGATITYGELARRADTVARAAGGGCGANPIAVVIPCHRVTAAGGALGGYSGRGGSATKRKLLALEACNSGVFALSP
ncbi:MAG: methylated-DNA--[protein]-cysteine S-methyltransferase [Rhodospirillaceae bacterium]|nr:methylated-DNA--[protein]-cysteine S-methyltransferase [Rhodospirillaceae bacterium]